jgi:pyrroline-5-carboxylate reductase
MNEHLKNKRIAFVGGGMMGGAIIHALIEKLKHPSTFIRASDPNQDRREFLGSKFQIEVTEDNLAAVSGADIVVLAVKPQMLPDVMSELKGSIPKKALVFSIIAGIPISNIQKGLQHRAVVRTMPNTPAQIGEAMTVWTASKDVTEEQRAEASEILRGMGMELYVKHEDALDMATAICGTGPTYAFLLMEALVDAAVHMGLSRADARPLVIQTVLGSAKLAMQSDKHLAELRNMVTSPGGTSAEAIYQMEKGGMRTILSKAVWAAYQKAHLLGKRAEEPMNAPLSVDSIAPEHPER